MSLLKRIFGLAPQPGTQGPRDVVTVVSGLPRSGTSMAMKMLEAGGLQPLTDNLRTADNDNPKGYYEFERVKALDKGDTAWVPEAKGKVVKVISALLRYLPPDHHYKVIFMQRRLKENVASQKKMLVNRGEATDTVTDEELMVLLEKHLKTVYAWLNSQPNVDVLYVKYHEVVENPREQARVLNAFLGGILDEDKMAHVADEKLYRNR